MQCENVCARTQCLRLTTTMMAINQSAEHPKLLLMKVREKATHDAVEDSYSSLV